MWVFDSDYEVNYWNSDVPSFRMLVITKMAVNISLLFSLNFSSDT